MHNLQEIIELAGFEARPYRHSNACNCVSFKAITWQKAVSEILFVVDPLDIAAFGQAIADCRFHNEGYDIVIYFPSFDYKFSEEDDSDDIED